MRWASLADAPPGGEGPQRDGGGYPPPDSPTINPKVRPNMTPATLQELETAMPHAEADFIVRMLKAGADVPTALQHRNADLERTVADQKKNPLPTPGKPQGVTPPRASQSATETDAGNFTEMVEAMMTRNPGMDRQRAILSVARKDPAAHQQYLLDTQPNRQARRLVGEKFDMAQA